MNKLVFFFLFFPLCLNAQNEEMQTLFGSQRKTVLGGYGAIEVKGSQLNGNFHGLLTGMHGGVIINNVFAMGLAGYGLQPISKVDCPIHDHSNTRTPRLTGGWGGFFLEYINSSNRLLHFTTNSFIGIGGVSYTRGIDYESDDYDKFKHPSRFVFVLEPGVTMELNVFKSFRMALGVSYRYLPNFQLQHDDKDIVPKDAFNGISVNLMLKLGNFAGKVVE